MRIHVEPTPETVQRMADTIDEVDTAFTVINLCSEGLTPQARQVFVKAWHDVQTVMSALKGPNHPYTLSVEENRKNGVAP